MANILSSPEGLGYGYMVVSWGGYIFLCNMIGIHAAYLACIGRYSINLYRTYSLHFLVGTICAIHVPSVGWLPLRSAEQLGPLSVFIAFQLFEAFKILKPPLKTGEKGSTPSQLGSLLLISVVVGLIAVSLARAETSLIGRAFFYPIRVRNLSSVDLCFIRIRVYNPYHNHTHDPRWLLHPYPGPFHGTHEEQHSNTALDTNIDTPPDRRTGNPLVDSVVEHQAANPEAYWNYLQAPTITALTT